MIKAILIDDEKNNLENLQRLLSLYCPEVEVTGTAINAAEARKVIAAQSPDLLFLDIVMPGEDGFQLLQSFPNAGFEVIFVTAHDQFGIQAIKFSAIDYLLKPINTKELQTAVTNAVAKLRHKQNNLQLENLLHLLQQQKTEHRIALVTQKETRFIPTTEIIYCTSTNNYTSFFLHGGEKIVVSKPIYEFEQLLADYGFIRCHQSYLVNKKRIKSWVKEDGGFLVLDGGTEVPVSRTKKDEVKKLLLG